MLAAFGAFAGGLINANIFGELTLILGGMDREIKEF